jgi:hypothetical protein
VSFYSDLSLQTNLTLLQWKHWRTCWIHRQTQTCEEALKKNLYNNMDSSRRQTSQAAGNPTHNNNNNSCSSCSSSSSFLLFFLSFFFSLSVAQVHSDSGASSVRALVLGRRNL